MPQRKDLVTPGPQPEMRQPKTPQGGGSLMALKILENTLVHTERHERQKLERIFQRKDPTVVPHRYTPQKRFE